MSGYTRAQMDAHLNAHRGLSEQQIAQGWVNQGGDPKYADLMAKIALRESSGRVHINNRGTNSNGTTDWGLFQVNDVWRKDPVVGPLFRSGAILTQAGATKAAIHILKVQGPQAWATYNPATDQKYLGAFKGGPSPKPARVGSLTAGTAPTLTPGGTSLDTRAVVTAALEDPRKGMSLAQRILGAATSGQYTTTTAPKVTAGTAPKYSVGRAASAAPGGRAANAKPGDPVAGGTSIGGLHPTEGLAGFPAHDYFAPAGSAAVAPVTGKVIRLSGHDPRQGPVEGPHGPLGWSVYIKGSDGRTYYLTHMGSRNVRVGETVRQGQRIGTVANYDKYGTPSHIHMGVSG